MSKRIEARIFVVLSVLALMIVGMLTAAGCADEASVNEPAETVEPAESEPEAPAEIDAQAVLEESCTLCHDASRIYLQSDATDWEDVIERMDVEHSKTQPGSESLLTAEQRDAIVAFMKSRTQSAGEVVVREKCVSCHELDNITKQAAGADWSTIIERMVAEHDASLTEQEQQDALNFLQGE